MKYPVYVIAGLIGTAIALIIMFSSLIDIIEHNYSWKSVAQIAFGLALGVILTLVLVWVGLGIFHQDT